MLTIASKLKTHLVIPDGVAAGVALYLGPKGKVKVKQASAAVLDAERNDLVVIHRPGNATEGKQPVRRKKRRRRKKKKTGARKEG